MQTALVRPFGLAAVLRNVTFTQVHMYYTVLSRASAHIHASTQPPILTVLRFFRVLRVTSHCANFLCSESEGRSAELTSCNCSDALWAPQHQVSKVHTTPSVASFTVFFPCSTKFTYCKRRLNTAETYQQGYESIRFVAQYNFLYCRAGLNESRTNRQCKSIWSHGC